MILNSNNIQKWLFDYFEGELTTIERKQVEQFILDNPEFHQEYIAWKDTMDESQDNEAVPVFTGMDGLMVATPLIHNFWFRSAASVAFIFLSSIMGIYFWMDSDVKNAISKDSSSYFQNNIDNSDSNKVTDYNSLDISNINYSSEPIINSYSRSLSLFNSNFISQPDLIRIENRNNQIRNQLIRNQSISTNNLINANSNNLAQNLDKVTRHKNKNTEHKVVAKKIRTKIRYKGLNNKNNKISNRKKPNYKFLNYRNDDVIGISNPGKYKDRSKPDSESNSSSIAERFKDGKPEKRRQSLKSKLKYMDLGLENINDPIFITNNSHTLFINPSLTGQMGYTRFKTSYRNQFFNESNNAQFAKASFDTYLKKLKAGIGFQSMYLHIDNLDYNTVSFNYAQKIEINRSSSLSIGTTFSLEKVRHNGLAQGMEINPASITNLPIIAAHKSQFNLGLSAWYSGKRFYGGFNVTNLLNPTLYATQESNSFMDQLNYSVQIGTDYKRSSQSNTVISPFAVLNKSEAQTELWTGGSIRYKALLFGLGGSTNLSAKATIGVQSHSFRISYGYDHTKSTIKDQYIGSHELSLRLLLGVEKNANILDY